MALHYRKRGETWHVRGTVRVGRRTVTLPEHSTGCRTRAEAEAAGAAEEARIRAEQLDGPGRTAKAWTIADCIDAYRLRPGGVQPYDADRLTDLSRHIGTSPMDEAAAAWGKWLRTRGVRMAPATAARWQATLKAALRHGAEEFAVAAPRLPSVAQGSSERVAYLTKAEEARLLASYNPWAGPVMLVLCETGLRTQEALQLDWRNVDWRDNVLFVEHSARAGGPRTKSGRSRRVGMRPVVRQTLERLWEGREKPETGRVFLNRRGKPYTDTRVIGGNPLASAHGTTCRKAGIEGFRIHDWRHHFAVWFLKNGGNLRALCQIAGWSSMRMVQRYAVYEQSDLDALMLKTA